jgi:hypothetical protein
VCWPLDPKVAGSKPGQGDGFIKVFLYIHLRSLNIRHFGMAESSRLKISPFSFFESRLKM